MILMQALKENAVLNETVSENLGKWLDQQKISYAEKEYEKLLYGDYIDLVRMLTDDHEFEMEEKEYEAITGLNMNMRLSIGKDKNFSLGFEIFA